MKNYLIISMNVYFEFESAGNVCVCVLGDEDALYHNDITYLYMRRQRENEWHTMPHV